MNKALLDFEGKRWTKRDCEFFSKLEEELASAQRELRQTQDSLDESRRELIDVKIQLALAEDRLLAAETKAEADKAKIQALNAPKFYKFCANSILVTTGGKVSMVTYPGQDSDGRTLLEIQAGEEVSLFTTGDEEFSLFTEVETSSPTEGSE